MDAQILANLAQFILLLETLQKLAKIGLTFSMFKSKPSKYNVISLTKDWSLIMSPFGEVSTKVFPTCNPKTSIVKMNKYVERKKPCLIDVDNMKGTLISPLFSITEVAPKYNIETHLIQ